MSVSRIKSIINKFKFSYFPLNNLVFEGGNQAKKVVQKLPAKSRLFQTNKMNFKMNRQTRNVQFNLANMDK